MEWKAVVGYEGIYEVSSCGQIRSIKRDKILSGSLTDKGYMKVTLYQNGKGKHLKIHRAVAEAFLPRIEGKASINHIDGNKRNNDVSNLEWCTQRDNVIHAYANGLNSNNFKVTLTNIESGEQHEFNSMAQASRWLGAHANHVTQALKRGSNVTQGFSINV